MTKATINLKYLTAAAICAARDERRYYLNGVLAEITEAGTRFVATDGHRVVVIFDERNPDGDCSNVLARAIIPLAICTHKVKKEPSLWAKKITKNPNDGDLEIDYETIRLTSGDVTYETKAIDGTFPDWRRVIPKKLDGKASTFNGKYLSDFERIKKIIGGSIHVCSISHNGDGACIVHLTGIDNAFGILMPVSSKAQKRWIPPKWV